MAMNSSNVSVLIPSFKNKELTLECIQSAILNDPGEIMISEDSGDRSLEEAVSKLDHPNIKFYYQTKNLGLWKNHRFLLRKATKPLIKFMQMDDLLFPGALKAMCDHITENTTVVSCLPIYRDLETGYQYKNRHETKPIRLSSIEFLERVGTKGNELGRPSNNLYRRDVLLLNEEAWDNEMSCDYVANVVAGSQGEVVMLPPQYIVTGIHKDQDTHQQSFGLAFRRWLNTLIYLKQFNNEAIAKAMSIVSPVEFLALHRNMMGFMRSGLNPLNGIKLRDYISLVNETVFSTIITDFKSVKEFYQWKYREQQTISIR